jgi:transcriptional regulator with XRE-family HTH domain
MKGTFKPLGEFIRESRKKSGVSLRELARIVNISAPFLSDIELGRRSPSNETLTRLAQALKMPVGRLKRHDLRVTITCLKKLIATSPEWDFALRTITERAIRGELTPKELLIEITKRKEQYAGRNNSLNLGPSSR